MDTTYSLKKLIDILGKNDFSLLLRISLDRIPIIVLGDDMNEVDSLVNAIIPLAPHHHEYVFWSDFISEAEYEQLCQEEDDDFNIPRIVFCSPTNASKHIFDRIKKLKGWVIGFDIHNGLSKESIIYSISEIQKEFLLIFAKLGEIKLKLYGLNSGELDLSFEKKLIDKAIEKTEIALEKMKRVLKKKIKVSPSNDVMASIMRFDTEEEKIRTNIFFQEIQSFIQAGMRSLAILSRIDLLRELGFNIELSGKTLLQTIDYEEVDADRMLQLLKAEYGVDFSLCIKHGKIVQVGDRIDGFWG
ncbi:MAG: hypothetical protein EU536_01980 [Promethearchaeota archaeon]|nr:MAG: hypothetical protein EU536_01980 [Candidatus Lokiarchaeota archaeon]